MSKEINKMSVCRVGRFESHSTNGRTLRQGVKEYVFLRSVEYICPNGTKQHVCYVETPANENWLTHNEKRLLPLMRILDKGVEALALIQTLNPR